MTANITNYLPPATVQKMMDSDAIIRMVIGPIGCVAADTLIQTEFGLIPISCIDRPMRVLSWNDKTCQFQLSWCGGAFPKGSDYLYQVLTPTGEFVASGHHRTLCADGIYRQVKSLRRDQSVSLHLPSPRSKSGAPYQPMSLADAPRLTQKDVDSLANYATSARLYGQQFLSAKEIGQVAALKQTYAPALSSRSADPFSAAHTGGQSERSHKRTHQSQPGAPFQIDGSDGHAWTRHVAEAGRVVSEFYERVLGLGRLSIQSLSTFFGHPTIEQLQPVSRDSYISSLSSGAIVAIEKQKFKQSYWDMQVLDTNNYVTADGTIHHNSGKSVGCAVELFRRMCMQEPDRRGLRPTRFVIIRNTYGELDDTTIPDFLEWFPDGEAGRYLKTARTFLFDFPMPDGTRVVSKWMFRALDKPKDVRKVKSLQITGAWINEAREVSMDIIVNVASRRGRYPSRTKQVPPTWAGVVMDTQPPDRTSDHYRLIQNAARFRIKTRDDEKRRPIFELFRQPSGLSPAAENIENLPVGYYQDQLEFAKLTGKSEDWINVHIHGEYGYLPNGLPVYGTAFKHNVHVAKETLEVIPNRTIGIGYDPGLVDTAAVIAQLGPDDQWRLYREVIEEGVDVPEMLRRVKMALVELGVSRETVIWYVDPAAKIRSSTDKKSPADIIRASGYRVIPSEKGIDTRVGAVRGLLNSPRLASGEPRLQIDPSMDMTVEGFLGGYLFKNVQNSDGSVRQKPDKNRFSHVMNAVEYLVSLFELARQKGNRKQWPGSEDGIHRRREPEVKPGSFNPHNLFGNQP